MCLGKGQLGELAWGGVSEELKHLTDLIFKMITYFTCMRNRATRVWS